MRDERPEPSWKPNRRVAVYAADQTYEWVGVKKRGRRQSVERVDAAGLPMEIAHEVYINSITVPVPSACGHLSDGDLACIRANHGSAYTEPFNNALLPLRPAAVKQSLVEFAQDACASVEMAALHKGCDTSGLTMREVAEALFGRPIVQNGGPTYFLVNEPLMKTDTKSYEDMYKLLSHLRNLSGSEVAVEIVHGDGQLCVMLQNVKRCFPVMYSKVVIGVAGFHEHAHCAFALNEGWYETFVKACLDVIGCVAACFQPALTTTCSHYTHASRDLVSNLDSACAGSKRFSRSLKIWSTTTSRMSQMRTKLSRLPYLRTYTKMSHRLRHLCSAGTLMSTFPKSRMRAGVSCSAISSMWAFHSYNGSVPPESATSTDTYSSLRMHSMHTVQWLTSPLQRASS